MAELKSRISLYLNQYEQELLFNARMVPLFSGNLNLSLPDTKDVLQALLHYTFNTVKRNRNSLKGFVNSLSRRKDLPEIEVESEDGDYRDIVRLEPTIPVKEGRIEPSYYDISRSRNVIFPLEPEDKVTLSDLDDLIRNLEQEIRLKLPPLTSSEIMKECIHFVLDGKNKLRTRSFRDTLYIGSWYSLKPLTSVKVLEIGYYAFEEIPNNLTTDEAKAVSKIIQDADIIDNFLKEARKNPYDHNDFESFLHLEEGNNSKVGGINYQLAFLGFWVLSNSEKIGITELPIIFGLIMCWPIKKTDWKDMLKFLEFELSFLLDISDTLNSIGKERD